MLNWFSCGLEHDVYLIMERPGRLVRVHARIRELHDVHSQLSYVELGQARQIHVTHHRIINPARITYQLMMTSYQSQPQFLSIIPPVSPAATLLH
jgi:hypothetical protein